jgi:hypothetical protein
MTLRHIPEIPSVSGRVAPIDTLRSRETREELRGDIELDEFMGTQPETLARRQFFKQLFNFPNFIASLQSSHDIRALALYALAITIQFEAAAMRRLFVSILALPRIESSDVHRRIYRLFMKVAREAYRLEAGEIRKHFSLMEIPSIDTPPSLQEEFFVRCFDASFRGKKAEWVNCSDQVGIDATRCIIIHWVLYVSYHPEFNPSSGAEENSLRDRLLPVIRELAPSGLSVVPNWLDDLFHDVLKRYIREWNLNPLVSDVQQVEQHTLNSLIEFALQTRRYLADSTDLRWKWEKMLLVWLSLLKDRLHDDPRSNANHNTTITRRQSHLPVLIRSIEKGLLPSQGLDNVRK